MKHILSFCLVVFTYGSIAGTFNENLKSFTNIKVRGNFNLYLKQGTSNTAKVVNNDENLADEKIILSVEGNTLNIKIKADTYSERKLDVHVTYTTLFGINSYRGCKVFAEDELRGDAIELSVDTGGKIKANVKTKTLICKVLSGGSIRVGGVADFTEYNISAGGNIAAIHLISPNVLAKVKAGGEVICSANEKLEIKITTGGKVSYQGNPKELIEKVLGGTVEKI